MRTATVTIDTLRGARSLVITRTEAAAGIEQGTIPAVKLGRRLVIPREKFLRLFAPDD